MEQDDPTLAVEALLTQASARPLWSGEAEPPEPMMRDRMVLVHEPIQENLLPLDDEDNLSLHEIELLIQEEEFFKTSSVQDETTKTPSFSERPNTEEQDDEDDEALDLEWHRT